MSVQTVLGPIGRDQLGVVMPHEHAFIDLTGFYTDRSVNGCENPGSDPVVIGRLGILNRDPYALRDNLFFSDETLQQKEASYLKKAGGGTIVDATTIGLGRDVGKLYRLASATGLHVIAGAGYYVGATHPPSLAGLNEDEIAKTIIAEIREGIDGTNIRAGVIGEIGVSESFGDAERKVLRASAIAQKETGLAISVHINPWTTNGLEALDILFEMGVKPNKICICHVDVENRRDYIYKLLKTGAYIEFDNFGKEYYVNHAVRSSGYGEFVKDAERVRLIAELINRGFCDQLLLSCDVCLKILLHAYGGWGYDHLLTNIVPMLLAEGIAQKDIDQMLITNPADFLEE